MDEPLIYGVFAVVVGVIMFLWGRNLMKRVDELARKRLKGDIEMYKSLGIKLKKSESNLAINRRWVSGLGFLIVFAGVTMITAGLILIFYF